MMLCAKASFLVVSILIVVGGPNSTCILDAKTKNTDQKSENLATGKNLGNSKITDVEEKDNVKCDTTDSRIATTNINSNIVTKSAKRAKGTICAK